MTTHNSNNNISLLHEHLETLYRKYNKRRFVSPDPLEFLYHYDDPADREVAAIIAASLAYGRVSMILKNVSSVLEQMDRSPHNFITSRKKESFYEIFTGFRHRFTDGKDLAGLLSAVKTATEKYGSLEGCFSSHMQREKNDCTVALSGFVQEMCGMAGVEKSFLLPDPARGSACKRMFLFLRWMVRRDEVDPGGWICIRPSALLVPLDTHMHRISEMLGFTTRRQANLVTAREITACFAAIQPDDPVKYDFALTRFGIRDELDVRNILQPL